MSETPTSPNPTDTPAEPVTGDGIRFRPRDQFWPYAELAEEPSEEELARLDPDLQAALYDNPPARPFGLTVVFSPFGGDDYAKALDLAKSADGYQETTVDGALRHRARFRPDQVLALKEIWHYVGRFDSSDVLIDDRPVPFARELWLPLFWYLIPR
jgi:hypothetical protein